MTRLDEVLTPYDQTVDRNFKRWVFQQNVGNVHFTAEQMDWLRMVKEHVAASIHFEAGDLDYAPSTCVVARAHVATVRPAARRR